MGDTKGEGSAITSAGSYSETLNYLRSSESPNSNSNLLVPAIPMMEEFIVSTSIEPDLSSKKSNERDTNDGP